jgi:2-[(L-alanin-3-ylcarbamoyl)methyl]-3-(2-aminoethylcarbamoyl)-2-hydroxypropanoate synthase
MMKLNTEPSADNVTAQWTNMLCSEHYRNVEQRVIRQLLQALIYEDLLPYQCEGSGNNVVFVISCKNNSADKHHNDQTIQYRCEGQIKYSFDLVKLAKQPVVRIIDNGNPTNARLDDVITDIVSPLCESTKVAHFINEMQQTLLKDLQAQAQLSPVNLSQSEHDYDELEGDLMDAHTYHPCYKSRIGFSLQDNADYGPEFKQPLQLHWLAIPKTHATMNHCVDLNYLDFIQQDLGEADYTKFAATLLQRDRHIKDYWLIPVHPWQWLQVVSTLFHAELAQQTIIWLGTGADNYRAQQSIRTLANVTAKQKYYVKLSLSITNTSTSRILANHTIMNGPVIADWLKTLIAQDTDAKDLDFIILGEKVGVSYDYQTMAEPKQSNAYGVLGAIWRESLHGYLRGGESAVPCNGLCQLQRDGVPLIDTWIRHYGVRPWAEQFLAVTVLPIIHMLFAQGIGMESHAQNIIVIHRQGWPTRIALKDFHDGVRFSPAHLTHPDQAPALYSVPESHARVNPNSFILTDDVEAVRDFSCDAFFFIALAEQAIFLEQYYQLPEQEFWVMVADIILDYQASHPQHQSRFQAFDVFAKTFQVEELTKRRLLGDAEARVRQVPNPLSKVRLLSC